MSRILARESVFKLTYEYSFDNKFNELSLADFLNAVELDAEDKDYIKKCTDGINEHYKDIISVLTDNLTGYKIERVYKIDLAILVVAIYELKYTDEKLEVVINEAIELSKKYSTDKSYSFVNGVLASIVRQKNE